MLQAVRGSRWRATGASSRTPSGRRAVAFTGALALLVSAGVPAIASSPLEGAWGPPIVQDHPSDTGCASWIEDLNEPYRSVHRDYRLVADGDEPPPWLAGMPRPRDTTVRVDSHRLRAVDGATIAIEVYLPEAHLERRAGHGAHPVGKVAPGAHKPNRLPTVVLGSPYHALEQSTRPANHVEATTSRAPDNGASCQSAFFLARGYAVVLWALRGTASSSGCLDHGGRLEQQDGATVVNWVTAQPWSDKTVGMVGHSHDAAAAVAAAMVAPKGLKAIAVNSVPFWPETWRPGATLKRATPTAQMLHAALGVPPGRGDQTAARIGEAAAAPSGEACAAATAEKQQKVVLSDGTYDGFFTDRWLAARARSVKAAVLFGAGEPIRSLDPGMPAAWRALEAAGVPGQLITGPWGHRWPRLTLSADGPRAYAEDVERLAWFHLQLRWFEHWLRGNDTGVLDEPRYLAFDRERRPVARDRFDDVDWMELHASGGCLTTAPAAGIALYRDELDVPAASSDPATVVCPRLQSGERPRVTYGSTAALTAEPLRITGAPRLVLDASIDQTDTDFAATLLAVTRNPATGAFTKTEIGRAFLDARHRGGLERPGEDVVPGRPETYVIDFDQVEYTLPAGGELWLDIASSHPSLVPDGAPAAVTVHEGLGRTRLRLSVQRADGTSAIG